MADFVLNLARTYPATVKLGVPDADGTLEPIEFDVVFNVKPLDDLSKALEAFAKDHADQVALSNWPVLWVVLESANLDHLKVKDSTGKKLPKSLYKDAVCLDPMLSAAVYREYNRTIVGNVPAAT